MTTAQRSTANRLIADKGQTVTLTLRSAGSYDPAQGSAAITETTQTAKGVILPLGGYRKFNGTSIVAGDETLLLSALDSTGGALAEPDVNTKITDTNGKAYTLTVVDPLRPAGLPILFDCVVRGHQ